MFFPVIALAKFKNLGYFEESTPKSIQTLTLEIAFRTPRDQGTPVWGQLVYVFSLQMSHRITYS